MVLIGAQGGPPPAPQGEPTPAQQEVVAMMQGNMDFFFGRYIRNIARYEPDLGTLKASPCTILPAIGAESVEASWLAPAASAWRARSARP